MQRYFIPLLSILLLPGLCAVSPAATPREASPVQIQAADSAEKIQESYTQAIAGLAADLGKDDKKNDLALLQTLDAIVHQSARPGAEPERVACAKALLAGIAGPSTLDAKVWMLKHLTFMGRAEVVAAETQLLGSSEPLLRETARCALEHNPTAEAAAALRAALAKATEPAWQGALALALGTRKDVPSIPALGKLLAGKDPVAAEAAIFALGSIADAEAAQALSGALASLPDTLHAAAVESCFKCAEQGLKDGKTADAAAIYKKLYQAQEPRPVRLAALQGLLRTSGDEAGPMILELLAGSDSDARAVAAGTIAALGSKAAQKLAAGLATLPAAGQLLVLESLATRGEKAALPAALACLKSEDAETRLTGLRALGRLGDASHVPQLVELLQAAGDESGPARDALLRLAGEGTTEALVAAMQRESDVKRRAALIEMLDARSNTAAAAALLQEALSDDANLRKPAMRALGKLGLPKDARAMIAALLKTAPGSERDEAEKAVMFACCRCEEREKQADPVLEAYASAAAADKLALLSVLGRIGGPKALAAIHAALASSDAEMSAAGLRGLCNWPDPSVAEELTKIAKSDPDANRRVTALRAFIRVVVLPDGLPDKDKLLMLQKAVKLAERDQERNLAIQRAGAVRQMASLHFVLPYLDQPELAEQTCATICELAHHRELRGKGRGEFEAALKRVLTITKNKGVRERTEKYLRGE